MELYQEIMEKYKEEYLSQLPKIDPVLIHDRCYAALFKIRNILSDPMLSDQSCFFRIEAIVCALEEQGIFCGARHDF